MPLVLPRRLAVRLQTREGRWAAIALGVLGATVLLALAVPLPQPDSTARDRAINAAATAGLAGEDLTAFLDTERWGQSLRERLASRAAAENAATGSGLNPVLTEMGYVGLIVTKDDSAMLLTLPEGGVTRHVLGDRTPDGRTLSALTDNTLTLRSSDGTEEVLELFPSQAQETDA